MIAIVKDSNNMSQVVAETPPLEKPRKKRKKRPPHKTKMITGYIIYASEIRKDVIKKFPDRDFGDISKLVGIEWKNLPQETKVAYEKRAQEQNAKSKAITAEAVELKKLADAAEERAKEQQQQQTPNQTTTTTTFATTVQYCNNTNNNATLTNGTSPAPTTAQLHPNNTSSSAQIVPNNPNTPQAQYQNKNNIIYRTPATIRQRPKDASTQSESIKWIKNEPKDPPKFSQKFIDYLSEHKSMIMAQLSSDWVTTCFVNCCWWGSHLMTGRLTL